MNQATKSRELSLEAAAGDHVPTQASEAAPSLLEYPATYLLIAINVAVYAFMVGLGPGPGLLRAHAFHLPSGAGLEGLTGFAARLFTTPFSEPLLILFGSCTPDRVLAFGQWWRLLTSIFVHVTLLHLLLNMWCLWNLGMFGERLLGKPGLIAVYVLTGIAGMLQSVLLSVVNSDLHIVVAGASGAVFGIAGILIVLLSNRTLAAPWRELRSLRGQVVFFALVNLLLGSLPGWLPRLYPGVFQALHLDPGTLPNVDNGAHLGGLLCGLALGLPLFPRLTSGRSSYQARQVLVFGSAGLMLILLSYAVATFARAVVGSGRV